MILNLHCLACWRCLYVDLRYSILPEKQNKIVIEKCNFIHHVSIFYGDRLIST